MIERAQTGLARQTGSFPSHLSLPKADVDFESAPAGGEPSDSLALHERFPELSESIITSDGRAVLHESAEHAGPGIGDSLKKMACAGLAALSFLGGILGMSVANTAEAAQRDRSGIERVMDPASDKPGKSADAAVKSTAAVNPSKAEIKELIVSTAKKHKVPADIALAVAWKETGWNHYSDDGTVVAGRNCNKNGKLISTDWGIMQVNDHAHPQAFPRAKTDIRYNIDFSVRLLKSLYKEQGSWQKAIRAYNGSDAYARSISRLMKTKPWLRS